MNHSFFDEIYRAFGLINGPKEAEGFLYDMLTPRERASVAERLQIFKLLAQGRPHREISKQLKVSIDKITRGAHALKASKGGFLKNTRPTLIFIFGPY